MGSVVLGCWDPCAPVRRVVACVYLVVAVCWLVVRVEAMMCVLCCCWCNVKVVQVYCQSGVC